MPGSQYQVSSARIHHSVYSLTDSSDVGPEDEEVVDELRLSPLQKLTTAMCKDEGTIKELIIGRRVGFYKVRGEIGYGTFSRVKLAFHALTKGKTSSTLTQGQKVKAVSNWTLLEATNTNAHDEPCCHDVLPVDKVALKILDKTRLDSQAQRLLSREITSMECLRHPNVIHLYEVVETPSRLYLVLEYAGGGDLHNKICCEGKLSDNSSKITFAQILSAIKYMVRHAETSQNQPNIWCVCLCIYKCNSTKQLKLEYVQECILK